MPLSTGHARATRRAQVGRCQGRTILLRAIDAGSLDVHEREGTKHLRSLNALKHQALDAPQDATRCALRTGTVGALNVRDLRGAWCARKPCANRYAVAHAYAPMIVETLHPAEIPHVSCVLSFHRTRSFHDKPLRLPKCRTPRRRRRLRNAPGGHRAKTVMSRGTTGPIDMCRGATGLKRSWYSGATEPGGRGAGGRGPGRGGARKARDRRGTGHGARAPGHRVAGPPGAGPRGSGAAGRGARRRRGGGQSCRAGAVPWRADVAGRRGGPEEPASRESARTLTLT
jgi:hypothetical protein